MWPLRHEQWTCQRQRGHTSRRVVRTEGVATVTSQHLALEPTQAEQVVIDNAAQGKEADLRPDPTKDVDPSEGADWGEERTIRAEVLYALCLGLRGDWPVHSKGVRLRGARITRTLDFESADVTHPVRLAECSIANTIVFTNARTRTVSLAGSWVPGITAQGLCTDGDLILNEGFTAHGEVDLHGVDIGGKLNCGDGHFTNPDGNALSADGATVRGDIILNEGFTAHGAVRLVGADIGGELNCEDGHFTNPDGTALSADGATVRGDVFLTQEFTAHGAVRLVGADIGGQLSCRGGHFTNPDGNALSADQAIIKGSVFLDQGFTAKGEVRLHGADFRGSFTVEDADFEGRVDAAGLRVANTLLWREVTSDRVFQVDLADARVGKLDDTLDAWPGVGDLTLTGFIYRGIADTAPQGVAQRLEWLRRQPGYTPGLYQQLAGYYRSTGRGQAARQVLIEEQKDRRSRGDMSKGQPGLDRSSQALNWFRRVWSRFLGATVAHGYRPWQAVGPLIVVVAAGAILFQIAFKSDVMVPTQNTPPNAASCVPDYPCFHSLLYALDTVLPIVDLRQQDYWRPDVSQPGGDLYRYLMWFSIAAGWILTTAVVVGVAAVLRPD